MICPVPAALSGGSNACTLPGFADLLGDEAVIGDRGYELPGDPAAPQSSEPRPSRERRVEPIHRQIRWSVEQAIDHLKEPSKHR